MPPISRDDKILVRELRVNKGYNAAALMRDFPNKGWNKRTLNRWISLIDRERSIDRKPGSGRPRTVRVEMNASAVEELILSQEQAPGTHKSCRQISSITGISRTSVHRIIKRDLDLKCFKRKRAQDLTEDNKICRLVRAKQLLKKYPEYMVPFIWFTDEKLFTVSAPFNSQNNRLYARSGVHKRNLPAERVLHTRATFSKSVMVSVGVSAMGSTDLIFVEPGTKINGAYYRDVLLSQHLLPAIKQYGDFFIFQQDSAPSHRAKETVELLSRETPDFIQPTLWPPNSPDLNPVDYKIWGLLQNRVYQTRINDVEHLKQRLQEEWSRFDLSVIDHAISEWRSRLRACVKASGGHFEHHLQ